MPAPLAARGIIVTISILAAAALAAYENENIRAWVDRTRQRIALGLYNLGDEISPIKPVRNVQDDASMNEEKGDAAEERRRLARAEIMERGRVLEERRKRRKVSSQSSNTQASTFDSLVDDEGKLIPDATANQTSSQGNTTAVEAIEGTGKLRSRTQIPVEEGPQPVDTRIPVRQLSGTGPDTADVGDPFASMDEKEMRTSWNLPLPAATSVSPSSHESESLLDLTPTTEDFPDPDYSIPQPGGQSPPNRSDYFSAAGSQNLSHTIPQHQSQYYYAHPSRPDQPLEPRLQAQVDEQQLAVSSASSVAGSTDLINLNEADVSSDDWLSEPDGIRTPASVWTDVESVVSGDH